MNYVIKMGDLGWRKQKGKSCLRVVCPCAAYRGISFGLLACQRIATNYFTIIYNSRNSFGLLARLPKINTLYPIYNSRISLGLLARLPKINTLYPIYNSRNSLGLLAHVVFGFTPLDLQ